MLDQLMPKNHCTKYALPYKVPLPVVSEEQLQRIQEAQKLWPSITLAHQQIKAQAFILNSKGKRMLIDN